MHATGRCRMETSSKGSNTGDERRKNNMEESYQSKNLGILHKNQGTIRKQEGKRDQIIS